MEKRGMNVDARLSAFKTYWWSRGNARRQSEVERRHVRLKHDAIAPEVIDDYRYGLGMVAKADLPAGTVLVVEQGRVLGGEDAPADSLWHALFAEEGKAYTFLEEASTSSMTKDEGKQQESNVVRRNCFGVPPSLNQSGESEVALFGALSIFNHSCAPNTVLHFVNSTAASASSSSDVAASDRFGSIVAAAYLIEDVKKGDQLLISYMVADTSVASRRDYFQTVWGFSCTCDRCQGILPKDHFFSVADAAMIKISQPTPSMLPNTHADKLEPPDLESLRHALKQKYNKNRPDVEGFDMKLLSTPTGLQQYEQNLLTWLKLADEAGFGPFHEQRNDMIKFLLMVYEFIGDIEKQYGCVMHRLVFESNVFPVLHPRKLQTYDVLAVLTQKLKNAALLQTVMGEHLEQHQQVNWNAIKRIKAMLNVVETKVKSLCQDA